MTALVPDLVARVEGRSQRYTPRSIAALNLHGRPLTRAKVGAKGVAGIRADLILGKLTVREFASMTTPDICRRYRVSRSQAKRLRKYISQHGVDGAKRRLDGTPRQDIG